MQVSTLRNMTYDVAHFVETPGLTIPLLHAVQRRFSCQIKHEKDGDCIITDEGQHRDEFALAT